MIHDHKKHFWMMILVHAIPILLILLLPKLGVSQSISFIVAIVLMMASHLFMIPAHNKQNKAGVKRL